MKLRRLETQDDFNNITKEDWIVIRYRDCPREYGNEFIASKNCFINGNNELIFDKRKNFWLNIGKYLVGESSVAQGVYMLEARGL